MEDDCARGDVNWNGLLVPSPFVAFLQLLCRRHRIETVISFPLLCGRVSEMAIGYFPTFQP